MQSSQLKASSQCNFFCSGLRFFGSFMRATEAFELDFVACLPINSVFIEDFLKNVFCLLGISHIGGHPRKSPPKQHSENRTQALPWFSRPNAQRRSSSHRDSGNVSSFATISTCTILWWPKKCVCTFYHINRLSLYRRERDFTSNPQKFGNRCLRVWKNMC